jgi:hypothetical protein
MSAFRIEPYSSSPDQSTQRSGFAGQSTGRGHQQHRRWTGAGREAGRGAGIDDDDVSDVVGQGLVC